MRAQKVMVQITGTQRLFSEWPETADSAQDGGADSTETAQTQQTLPGLYSCQKGAHFVVYEEDDGEGHVTRSTVKITEDSFEVMRKGAGCVRMAFRAGRRSECWYDTPCGRMPVVFDVKEAPTPLPTGHYDTTLGSQVVHRLYLALRLLLNGRDKALVDLRILAHHLGDVVQKPIERARVVPGEIFHERQLLRGVFSKRVALPHVGARLQLGRRRAAVEPAAVVEQRRDAVAVEAFH